MTSSFWKWLSRANARTALWAAAAAFLLVAGYWVWREVTQEGPESIYPAGAARMDPSSTNRVELLAYIKARQAEPVKVAHNPFFRRKADPPPPNNPKPDPVDPFKTDPPKVVETPKPKPPPPPPPPPPPKETPMLYRGLMQRGDGTWVALLENQATKKQKFYAPGDPVFKSTVNGIDAGAVSLKRPNGDIVTLARGQVVRVRED